MRGGKWHALRSGTPQGVKPTDTVPTSLSRNREKGYPCDLC